MNIFIDEEFKCHTEGGSGRSEVESSFFDNKCQEFIEGYRFVPSGSTWVREDGAEFKGEMISPYKDLTNLIMAQLNYEKSDAVSALTVLGVTK